MSIHKFPDYSPFIIAVVRKFDIAVIGTHIPNQAVIGPHIPNQATIL